MRVLPAACTAVLAAGAAIVATALPASAATLNTHHSGTSATASQVRDIPKADQVASVHEVKGTPQRITTAQAVARAAKAGVSPAKLTGMGVSPQSSGCWDWPTYLYYNNAIGNRILQFNVEPSWCGNGSNDISDASYLVWGDTIAPGWSYTRTKEWSKYGNGWNVYEVYGSGHFCLAQYFDCVQNEYPWIEDEVGAGGQTYFFHHS